VTDDLQDAANAAGSGNLESPGAAHAADRVAAIVAAAEETAERLRIEAETRMRERIAEGDRAADYRVAAAEAEALDAINAAHQEAARIRGEAEEIKTTAASEALTIVAEAHNTAEKILDEARGQAAGIRAEAEERTRKLVGDARDTAAGVRAEGLELVSNLREMGDSLRSNADRLLRDVQRIHSRMIRDLGAVDVGGSSPTLSVARRAGAEEPERPTLSRTGEVLDVPEFMPGGQ
jgi:vacuolar-type H+-ATPase subunit H